MPAKILLLLLVSFAWVSVYADDAATVYIVSPADGAVVTNPVKIIFGLSSNYGVAPAGVVKDKTGHHHLLIDTPLPAMGEPIPKDENHHHFGGGQTEVEVELAPGGHTLQLLLGNFAHIPHSPPIVSEAIKITVE